MPRKDKPKQRKPTAEEFLSYRPQRLEFEWTTDDQGLVHITVPKFQSEFGKKFCKLIRRDQVITADMDELGSIVWKLSDGDHTVADILNILKERFPDEDNLDQRLFLFIQQMGQLQYITY